MFVPLPINLEYLEQLNRSSRELREPAEALERCVRDETTRLLDPSIVRLMRQYEPILRQIRAVQRVLDGGAVDAGRRAENCPPPAAVRVTARSVVRTNLPKRRPGRPSRGTDIRRAHRELSTAGPISSQTSMRAKAEAIRRHLTKNGGSPRGLGYEAIRRALTLVKP